MRLQYVWYSVLGLVVFSAMGCSDENLTKLTPKIEVDPERIDFGDGIVDQENPAVLEVFNRGSGTLEIRGTEVDRAPVFGVRGVPETVLALSEDKMTVFFVPERAHEQYTGSLLIRSNDPMTPELTVPLEGVGGVREIEVFPEEIDFGIVNEGTSPRRGIEIRNVGGDPLDVSSITWTSTSVDLVLVPGTFVAGIVAPQTSTVVEVVYSPVDLGYDEALITITSNDEDEGTVTVPVFGRGNLAPRAIAWGCSKVPNQVGCDGQTTIRTLAAEFQRIVGLDGRESWDPESSTIASYRWELIERPPQSVQTIFHTGEDITLRNRATGDITIDWIGTFDLRLVVRDERGLESLDRPESHVEVLPSDLEFLVTRDISADVDLHVVRPLGTLGDYGSGQVGTSTGTDCTAFNREPNWGDPGTDVDDPFYHGDAVTAILPEIVSVNSPEDTGPYGVFIHYCGDPGEAEVNVQVEIYVKGSVIQKIPAEDRYRLAPGEVWEAARVTWEVTTESAQVEELSQGVPVMMPNLCLAQ